jgi:nitrogen fixation NifU-like protein
MYNDIVMKRFESPKFSGSLKNANAKASVASQECGDEIEFQLFVKDDLIKDIRFKTFGCAAAIASADMLAEMAHEKSLAEAKRFRSTEAQRPARSKAAFS